MRNMGPEESWRIVESHWRTLTFLRPRDGGRPSTGLYIISMRSA